MEKCAQSMLLVAASLSAVRTLDIISMSAHFRQFAAIFAAQCSIFRGPLMPIHPEVLWTYTHSHMRLNNNNDNDNDNDNNNNNECGRGYRVLLVVRGRTRGHAA